MKPLNEEDVFRKRGSRDETAGLPMFQQPADYAEPAAQTDDGEKLLALAERAANAILDAQGKMCIYEVRAALGDMGLLANDGTEHLDGLGALGRRMHLKAIGDQRPPKEIAEKLKISHSNKHTVWARRSA